MSSINTNISALVALQNLRAVNTGLSDVQNEISTGKRVSSSKDNAAIWAVSSVIETDVRGFGQISNSLNLGSATVGVARQSAETVTDLLNQIQEKIIAAQEDNVDRGKIQTDVEALRDQITSIVNAAQFNGANLLNGGADVTILSSLDRDSSGNVSASYITVASTNLDGTASAVAGTQAAATAAGGITDLDNAVLAAGANQVIALESGAVATSNTAGATTGYEITIAGQTVSYALRAGETQNDAVEQLAAKINELNISGISAAASTVADTATGDASLTITNASGASVVVNTISGDASTAGGDLAGLSSIDVSTEAGASSALNIIEGLIQSAIDASARFGSAQKRIETQDQFVSRLVDSLTVGVSALTDADLEEASARLQSLQVQQQLGVQSLSIANQTPQTLLSLFR